MNQLENKLSSREVCEMMEIEHTNLLKKIDSINVDFREVKIDFSKYWQESTYKVEGQLREYREFQITKRGCEFLAHKTTGTKGNLFTDKYMAKFAMMEQAIRTGSYNATGKTRVDEVLEIIRTLPTDKYKNKAVAELMRLIPVEQKQLQVASLSKEEVQLILDEFLEKDDVIIRKVKQGLAIKKEKLYKEFKKYNLSHTGILKMLDDYGFIYHKDDSRTLLVKFENTPTRAIILNI